MTQPLSIRLDEQARSGLEAMAQSTKRSRSYLVNEAVHAYLRKEAKAPIQPIAEPIDISAFVGSMKGEFGGVEEIDEYVKTERSSWD